MSSDDPEGVLVRPDVPEDVLTLEHVDVGERHSTAHRVAGEGDPVQEARLR